MGIGIAGNFRFRFRFRFLFRLLVSHHYPEPKWKSKHASTLCGLCGQSGQWVVVLTRAMISVLFLFFFGNFSLCSILMKCMRWRLSADIFSAKVLWTFLATRLAYIINNCTRGALSRLKSTHLMAYEGLVLTPGALTFFGFLWLNEIWL